jgi:hypothetical protein
MISEALLLRQTWFAERPSYLHAYLDNGLWGSDRLWDGVAANAFTVFICLYAFPEEVSSRLLEHVQERGNLPSSRMFARFIAKSKTLQDELDGIRQRAQESRHHTRQLEAGG